MVAVMANSKRSVVNLLAIWRRVPYGSNSGCRMRVVQPLPTPVTSTATAAATMSENMKINYSSSWDSGEMAAEIYWCSTVWNNNNRCSTVWNNSNNNRQSGYRMMFVGSIVILSTCWHIYQIYYVMWYFIESVPFITATIAVYNISSEIEYKKWGIKI